MTSHFLVSCARKAPILLLAFSFFLAGCAKQYTFFPPESQQGMVCVSECKTPWEACKIRAEERAKTEFDYCTRTEPARYQQCQSRAQAEYAACLKYANETARKSCALATCYERKCSMDPNYDRCDSDYRQCYRGCGGQIRED